MARNFSFLKSKRFWVLLALGITFLAIVASLIFFSRGSTMNPRIGKSLLPENTNSGIASFIYRYDPSKKIYVPEISGGWQNKDFIRYVFDVSQGSPIAQCSYFVYDAGEGKINIFSERACNTPLTLTVGEQGVCSSQGQDSCIVYVYATDEEGRSGEVGMSTYSIDYNPPLIGMVGTQEGQVYPITVEEGQRAVYTVSMTDNVGLFGCWLYGDEQFIGPMQLSSLCAEDRLCKATATYMMPRAQERQLLWAQCADYYDTVRGEYLNIGYGQTAEVVVRKNHPPQISSCSVAPAQGKSETLFAFNVQAHDPDGQGVTYIWEFGDGDTSSEESPRYRYKNGGVFRPEVSVQDEQGESAECSTAWVIVE